MPMCVFLVSRPVAVEEENRKEKKKKKKKKKKKNQTKETPSWDTYVACLSAPMYCYRRLASYTLRAYIPADEVCRYLCAYVCTLGRYVYSIDVLFTHVIRQAADNIAYVGFP